MNYKSCIAIVVWLTCFPGDQRAQELKLARTFGSHYQNAQNWLGENNWIVDSLQSYGVPPGEALSIVFPELIRYSAIWDGMEVTGLLVLYIRFGKQYADFSVGHFQMKPSFLEELEKEAARWLSPAEIAMIIPALQHGEDTKDARENRVNALTYTLFETRCLALYYKICLMKFMGVKLASATDRIRFLATAYNCGFDRSETYIRQQMNRKHFPTGRGGTEANCNYASVSLAWWKECNFSYIDTEVPR
jgi:hypothetical protein